MMEVVNTWRAMQDLRRMLVAHGGPFFGGFFRGVTGPSAPLPPLGNTRRALPMDDEDATLTMRLALRRMIEYSLRLLRRVERIRRDVDEDVLFGRLGFISEHEVQWQLALEADTEPDTDDAA